MRSETKRHIERVKMLNSKPAEELTDAENKEFLNLCVIAFFPLLDEIERLNGRVKAGREVEKTLKLIAKLDPEFPGVAKDAVRLANEALGGPR
jgi:hypothetical protein